MKNFVELIQVIVEHFDKNYDITPEHLSYLVEHGFIEEEQIEAILDLISEDNFEDVEEAIYEIIAISNTYSDYMHGVSLDEEENGGA